MEILEVVKDRLSLFKNLYDTIRIVDPINKRVINSGGGNTELENGSCYGLCGKDINDSSKYNKPLCVVMADLDFFKNVNDNYGHVVGDWVLKDFAKLLSTAIRSSSDWVGRYGGEEFLIVLGNTDGNEAFHVIEKIRKLVEENIFSYDNVKIKITSSFGAYAIQNRIISIDELICEADKNLYIAKNSGRNKTIINL